MPITSSSDPEWVKAREILELRMAGGDEELVKVHNVLFQLAIQQGVLDSRTQDGTPVDRAKLGLTLRQEFATLVLGYAVVSGTYQWFETGFKEEDEVKYSTWLESLIDLQSRRAQELNDNIYYLRTSLFAILKNVTGEAREDTAHVGDIAALVVGEFEKTRKKHTNESS